MALIQWVHDASGKLILFLHVGFASADVGVEMSVAKGQTVAFLAELLERMGKYGRKQRPMLCQRVRGLKAGD